MKFPIISEFDKHSLDRRFAYARFYYIPVNLMNHLCIQESVTKHLFVKRARVFEWINKSNRVVIVYSHKEPCAVDCRLELERSP